MGKLEEMMIADGWVSGYSENWGVKYFSFRKDGFEIDWKDINEIWEGERDSGHFKKWRPEEDGSTTI